MLETHDALIDIDNILWDQTRVLYRLLSKKFEGFPHYSKWSIDFYRPYMAKEEFTNFITKVQSEQLKYKPFNDSAFFLEVLRYKLSMTINICSARPKEHYNIVTRWLRRHRLIYDNVYLCDGYDKSMYVTKRTKLIVDDHPIFLNTMRKERKDILLATIVYSYNKYVKEVLKVRSLTELANNLLLLCNNAEIRIN